MSNFKRLMMNTLFASAMLSFGAQAQPALISTDLDAPPEKNLASSAVKIPAVKSVGFDKDAITKVLQTYQLNISSIEPSPINDLFEVVTDKGVVYATPKGDYFIYGQLFYTSEKGSVNLTERAQAKRNLALFEEADVEKELIIFPAKDEKYVITVFTDTTCGYCKKLHSEMKEYNDLGITIRYLAFPRSGERSPNIGQMSAIWCSVDKVNSMNLAKVDKFDEVSEKCTDVIRRHMKLGEAMGVSGTPAILLKDGTMLSGYMPAKQLLSVLEKNANTVK